MAKALLTWPARFLGVCLLVSPALAQGFDSTYTSLDLSHCHQQPVDRDDPVGGGVWWCEGYSGIPVRVAEGDLRFLVSFGADAAMEPAAGQTLPQFNRINATLEWRLAVDPSNGKRTAIATILRYFVENQDGTEGQVLVVTKLGGRGQVCHIGYVDAQLNPDANALARQAAEAGVAQFDCSRHQPSFYGIAPK